MRRLAVFVILLLAIVTLINAYITASSSEDGSPIQSGLELSG